MTITLGGSGSANQLRSDLASAASTALGDALVGVKKVATSAVGHDQHDENERVYGPEDFGADPANSAAANAAAFAALLASGRNVVFPNKTYNMAPVAVNAVNNISVDATKATFIGSKTGMFTFYNCNDLYWKGGVFKPGTDSTGLVPVPSPGGSSFFPVAVMYSSNSIFTGLRIYNDPTTPAATCITYWVVTQGVISDCLLENGGDNTIYAMASTGIDVVGNVVTNNIHGRAICYQMVSRGTITGNTVQNGKGFGITVHGSDNISITGNTVIGMAYDANMGFGCGITVEVDENATAPLIASANAGGVGVALYVFNNVYSRNIVISGNSISGCQYAMSFGSQFSSGTLSGSFYGNYGNVLLTGNTFSNCSFGVQLQRGTRAVRFLGNWFRDTGECAINFNFNADSGAYLCSDIEVTGNTFNNCSASGTSPIGVTGAFNTTGTVSIRDNYYDDSTLSNGIVLGTRAQGNVQLASVGNLTTGNTFDMQQAFGSNTLASSLTTVYPVGVTEYTLMGAAVNDTPFTILTLPSNASAVVDVQIGQTDRLVVNASAYFQNGTTPALTVLGNGSGAGYITISGANLQIKGHTSGGTQLYGGVWMARIKVIRAV